MKAREKKLSDLLLKSSRKESLARKSGSKLLQGWRDYGMKIFEKLEKERRK